MELILLSGNSKMTEEWINEVASEIGPLFDQTHVQFYRHWTTGEEMIDFDHELDALSDYLKDKEDYIIFAKSAGAALAAKGITEGKISPLKCMLVGVPVDWCEKNGIPIKEWFSGFSVPSFFVQKTDDPAMGASDLRRFLTANKVRNCILIEIPGKDHHYENVAQLKELMAKLLK